MQGNISVFKLHRSDLWRKLSLAYNLQLDNYVDLLSGTKIIGQINLMETSLGDFQDFMNNSFQANYSFEQTTNFSNFMVKKNETYKEQAK